MSKSNFFIAFLLFFSANVFAACPVDGAQVGKVEATIVGIEVQPHCTFILLDNVNSEFSNHDSNPFAAGRFKYIGVDPENVNYNAILSLASMAFATKTRIYTQVTSRTGRVDHFSLSTQENNH